ncbi:flagellar assembly peptidoglycan hydrolase FlgJ [Stutzerimonas tarimensis]|uniref:Peptidoglycan hydrolase FlgJ n=1 Tax=Stutzerimonas tarimensis TaxID=1507735 RepID=A0ABV7T363_9GAMM
MQSRSGAIFDSGSYTDLNRLHQFKVGDRDSEANVRKVAQEFESVFLNQMLKSMRSASDALADEDSPFNSQAAMQYRDMYDQQLAISMSREGGGIGLADVLTRQLSKQQGPAATANPFAQVQALGEAAKPASATATATAPATAAAPAVAEGRDDSRLLNMRRLALPPRPMDRQLAGTDGLQQAPAGDDKRLVNTDWKPAQTFAVAADKPLTVNGEGAGKAPSRFESAEQFIATMLPMAEKAAQRLGVEARYLVAQAALETGWGKHMIRQKDGANSHNLFGIKATAWKGPSAQVTTTEYVGGKPVKEVAGFRAYESFEHSFNDYVNLLESSGRYRTALQVASHSGDSEGFVRELQKAGYATDPNYAKKISQIARKMQTYQMVADAGSGSSVQGRG